MNTKCALNPSLERYTYIIKLFVDTGHLEMVVRMIHGMSSSHGSWKWANVNMERWTFNETFEWVLNHDKRDGPTYIFRELLQLVHERRLHERRPKTSKPWRLGTKHGRGKSVVHEPTQLNEHFT